MIVSRELIHEEPQASILVGAKVPEVQEHFVHERNIASGSCKKVIMKELTTNIFLNIFPHLQYYVVTSYLFYSPRE